MATRTASKPDAATRRWMRNASDEAAVRNGCKFDEKRGQFVVDWIQSYCILYEGEKAGQRMTLEDWQYDATMRAFGWVRFSDDWKRWVRRFNRASIFVAKKNAKSPSAAAWGLYLFAGDGEPGQKVYSTAKDGKQALISHMHAVEMVRRSPDLFSECKINQSTWQINHLPSASIYRVVAGDNRKSQEGLNGSVIVDETHVVDRELMTILRGAGISRSEPLQAEFSTAGNNPDGYGKSQWDYGTSVNAGEFEDQGFLFIPYAAPQDLTDSELDEDPIKYARMANPTLGRIVKEEEFLASYQTAKRSLTDLLAFKMYRLNIWQRSANPWLKIGDWEACRNDFTEADLEGAECFAGLDLSRTRDMCALALLFPDWEQESYYLLPYFWLPEAVAMEQGHLAPFRQWAASGHLELTPGNVVDYGFIKARFREKARQFNIRLLSYDMTYANELTQSLEQGEVDPAGRELAEATGIERQAFPQTIMAFAGPTAEFERLVLAAKMLHNGHPVMNWQVGHVQVKTDANQNKRPVKPNSGDIRKIDGCVAGIMALAGAMERGPDVACKVEAW